MKRNYSLYFLAGGLLLVTIQLLVFLFGFLNPDTYNPEVIFSSAEEVTFGDFLSKHWSGIIGTILLICLFVRRLSKGPEAMLVLVGALLWVIQILSLHNPDAPLGDFIVKYIIGIVGTLGVAVSGFYDAYLIKSSGEADKDK